LHMHMHKHKIWVSTFVFYCHVILEHRPVIFIMILMCIWEASSDFCCYSCHVSLLELFVTDLLKINGRHFSIYPFSSVNVLVSIFRVIFSMNLDRQPYCFT
jgi:hypothetical protein